LVEVRAESIALLLRLLPLESARCDCDCRCGDTIFGVYINIYNIQRRCVSEPKQSAVATPRIVFGDPLPKKLGVRCTHTHTHWSQAALFGLLEDSLRCCHKNRTAILFPSVWVRLLATSRWLCLCVRFESFHDQSTPTANTHTCT
jgi:hypothetical protein